RDGGGLQRRGVAGAHDLLERADGDLRGGRLRQWHRGGGARSRGLGRAHRGGGWRFAGRRQQARARGAHHAPLDRGRRLARVRRGARAARGGGAGARAMRLRMLAANWKMHKTVGEAVAFAKAFLPRVADLDAPEIAIAPPFTALAALGRALEGSRVRLAAQNVHDQPSGAFTGEVAPAMLAELGCAYAIVGHSERRQLFGESSEFVARKAAALFAHAIHPIVCVGETLEEREAGRTFAVLQAQLGASLDRIEGDQIGDVVIAYEPVWAIGTGRTATPAMAHEAHA